MDLVGSEIQRLMANLALTQRYQVCPRMNISHATMMKACEVFQNRARTERLRKRKAKQEVQARSLDPMLLQHIVKQLDSMPRNAPTPTRMETQWLTGDWLLASVDATIREHPSYLPGLDKECLFEGREQHNHRSKSMSWLLTSRQTIRLLISASCCSVHHMQLAKERRANNMQSASEKRGAYLQASHFDNIDTQSVHDYKQDVVRSVQDVRLLLDCCDFPPIYLGTPLPQLPGNLDGATAIKCPDINSTMHLLYLQLRLRCDPFYVHCTGSTHIKGK